MKRWMATWSDYHGIYPLDYIATLPLLFPVNYAELWDFNIIQEKDEHLKLKKSSSN